MNMNWAWTHDLLHGCPATYPLHQSNQLLIEVEGTSYNKEIVKLIPLQRMMLFEMQLFLNS